MAYRLLIDERLCTGCRSCEVACQLEHGLPAETRPMRILSIGPFHVKGSQWMVFQPSTCTHCASPVCVQACAQGAMQQRPDGIVFSDPGLCIGCRSCAAACPTSAPVFNPSTGKIAKCDYCLKRVENGLQPACVVKCPTGALAFGVIGQLVTRRQRKFSEQMAAALPGSWQTALPGDEGGAL